jgi:hypothetical protein
VVTPLVVRLGESGRPRGAAGERRTRMMVTLLRLETLGSKAQQWRPRGRMQNPDLLSRPQRCVYALDHEMLFRVML